MNEQRKIETEEVGEAAKPPRARVIPPRYGEGDQPQPKVEAGGGVDAPPSDAAETPSAAETFARKRDYLEGFISRPPRIAAEPTPVEPGGDLYEAVIEALKDIYDPEIPVNIYDLGLIYDVEITPDHHARIKMTLTTPHCPVAESMPGEVELRVGAVPGIGDAEVELVWHPPWDPQKMSDEAKLELGML